ncbi:hypothetical protein BDR06DRAFT_970255 [Suillus hirtellus]|nr:hypothetical protein BDR06DRAFT_970255 [Suillus hirtellus]
MAPDRMVQSSITADKLRKCQNSTNVVLELDSETGETLDVWYWPVNDNRAHVVPSDLAAYRKSHQFQGPHCLCAFIDDHNPNDPREAAIVMSKRGLHTGEYIARCALSKCGYVGPDEARPLDIVFVDREGMSMEKLT